MNWLRPLCLSMALGGTLGCTTGGILAAVAEETPQGASEDADFVDLLTLLDDQTQLATKNGMNADYTPGMATILLGDDLRVRGVRTVWEALALVPGIDQGLETTGERQILSRGVGQGYASGNVKFLLNGVPMNSTFIGTANPVLNLPIEQVQRIDVIRGPGSSVYGEFAYAGVVDIVTRQSGRELHLRAGGASDYGGGAIWTWQVPDRDVQFSINLAGLEGDGGDVEAGADALFALGQAERSFAPGPVNQAQRYRSLFADLRWGNLFASVAVLDDAYGDHFGINHFLSPDDGGLASRQRDWTLQVGYDHQHSDRLNVRLRFQAMRHGHERDRLYVFPAEDEAPAIYLDRDYRETRYRASVDVHWQASKRHKLLLGLEASHAGVDRATWDWIGLPGPVPDGWLDTGLERRIYSVFVQDEFRPVEPLTLTATLRYDDYSDVDSFVSPRLAAVWHVEGPHILKAQYALAFRPPTFYEVDYPASGSLKTSEIGTFELGYILKQASWDARLMAFQSDLKAPISFDERSNDGYINAPDVRLRGIEIEYQRRWERGFKLDGNLSYVDTQRRPSGDALPGGANLLANLALYWHFRPEWTGVLQGRYVGARQRRPDDPRSALAGYTRLDLTLSYEPDAKGPFVSFGVKNLTNADVRYPDQFTSLGGEVLAYPDDYPRPDRRLWFSAGVRF